MPYETKETRTCNQPVGVATKSAAEAVNQLGGKTSKKNNPADGRLEANFNKKIKGKIFGNRYSLKVQITFQTSEQCTVSVKAYPADPIGNKLMFGVRGDPARLVADRSLANLDKRIAG